MVVVHSHESFTISIISRGEGAERVLLLFLFCFVSLIESKNHRTRCTELCRKVTGLYTLHRAFEPHPSYFSCLSQGPVADWRSGLQDCG